MKLPDGQMSFANRPAKTWLASQAAAGIFKFFDKLWMPQHVYVIAVINDDRWRSISPDGNKIPIIRNNMEGA
jgi:hypothetical protein